MGRVITQFSRISHHTVTIPGATFSVPSSENFTDGTWIEGDLCLSEIGVNEADSRVYMRVGSEIIEFGVVPTQSSITTSTSSVISFSYINNQLHYLIGADTTYNPVQVNLPSASSGLMIVHIKDIGANSYNNNITVLPNGSDTIITTIIGGTFSTIQTNGGAIICSSDGVDKWWLM